MYRNVLEFHGLSQDLDHDDFYPTKAVTELIEDIKSYMKSRPVRFGVLYGCVGVGKSTILNILVEAFKASHGNHSLPPAFFLKKGKKVKDK